GLGESGPDEDGAHADVAETLHVVGRLDAALAHEDDLGRDRAGDSARRLEVHVERREVAVVDPDHGRSRLEGERDLALVADLDERSEAERARRSEQAAQEAPFLEEADDEEGCIRSRGARLDELVAVENEVLPKGWRRLEGAARRSQIFERAP